MSARASWTSDSAGSPDILIVEEDPDARQLLRSTLSAEHYRLRESTTAATGLAEIEALRPALMVTELDLPDLDGIEMIRHIRARKHLFPIVVVSARFNQESIIAALDAGADDFVLKPWSVGELGARIRVALRHAKPNQHEIRNEIFRAGGLEVDFDRRRVQLSGREVHLAPLEYRMLCVLIVHADRVVTYKHLLQELWKSEQDGNTQHVRVYMAQLRRKLEFDPSHPRYLITAHGVGYQFHTIA